MSDHQEPITAAEVAMLAMLLGLLVTALCGLI